MFSFDEKMRERSRQCVGNARGSMCARQWAHVNAPEEPNARKAPEGDD
jgi:hypothetical protein